MAKPKEIKLEPDQQGAKNGPNSKKLVQKNDEAHFPTEFKGNMKEAMQHL